MEFLNSTIDFLMSEQFKAIFGAVGGLVLSANIITANTPSKVDDKYATGLGKLYNLAQKGLNFLSMNVKRNKNKDDV